MMSIDLSHFMTLTLFIVLMIFVYQKANKDSFYLSIYMQTVRKEKELGNLNTASKYIENIEREKFLC